MNAALGVRFFPEAFFAVLRAALFLAAGLRALFLADFFAVFLLAAIACLPVIVRTLPASKPAKPRDQQYTDGAELQ
jgi:hypothetical protein